MKHKWYVLTALVLILIILLIPLKILITKQKNVTVPDDFETLNLVTTLDKELIKQNIENGKEFLLRSENRQYHGFYKRYDALNDSFGSSLNSVYSASIVYTLLKVYDYDHDKRISDSIDEWGNFLISMQNKEEKEYGAFHYSYNLETKQKDMKFVSGTAALNIFTLLSLYERTQEQKYLDSAKMAGDWLITMQNSNGSMIGYKRYENGKQYHTKKESLLYNGQSLSALSRLYKATGDKRYYDAAEKIAMRHIKLVEEKGCYLGDDYRTQNPISSAWVVMSLLDFYKISPKEYYKEIIFNCSRELLKRQANDPSNLLTYGQWAGGAYSTSGNGWLAEVMAEMYFFCNEEGKDCDEYKDAVVKVIRWLVQNTYSEKNSYFLPNPNMAIGGLYWDSENLYVRTDSICHGVNAYIGMMDYVGEGDLLVTEE